MAAALTFGTLTLAADQSPRPRPLENPSAADLERGGKVFTTYCARCHGLDGSGGMGPPLNRPKLRRGN